MNRPSYLLSLRRHHAVWPSYLENYAQFDVEVTNRGHTNLQPAVVKLIRMRNSSVANPFTTEEESNGSAASSCRSYGLMDIVAVMYYDR